MRTNPRTIKLAKIRRYIRQAAKWRKVDNGLPYFYTSENYKRSKRVTKVDGVIGSYPYYIKSDRAIAEIAEKIYELCE